MKSLCFAYVLWLVLGWCGAHRFYLGFRTSGLVYMFTLGVCGVGWVVDFFRLPRLFEEVRAPLLPHAAMYLCHGHSQACGGVQYKANQFATAEWTPAMLLYQPSVVVHVQDDLPRR